MVYKNMNFNNAFFGDLTSPSEILTTNGVKYSLKMVEKMYWVIDESIHCLLHHFASSG